MAPRAGRRRQTAQLVAALEASGFSCLPRTLAPATPDEVALVAAGAEFVGAQQVWGALNAVAGSPSVRVDGARCGGALVCGQ